MDFPLPSLINGGGCSPATRDWRDISLVSGLVASTGNQSSQNPESSVLLFLGGKGQTQKQQAGAQGVKVAVPADDHGSRLPLVDRHPRHKPHAPSSDSPSAREEIPGPKAVGLPPHLAPRSTWSPAPSHTPAPLVPPLRCPSLCALPCPSPLRGRRQRKSPLSTATGAAQAAAESRSETAPGSRAPRQRTRSARCARTGMGRPG